MTIHPEPPRSRYRGLSCARRSARACLRFITCGSVDDGKSTLIGRLLYETERFSTTSSAPSKRLAQPRRAGGDLDLALLLDGLAAEREQEITIDVAYRYFTTHTAQIHHR